MPLPTSGVISLLDINNEFGRGYDLNSYRGTQYYTSSAGPFTFSSGLIDFDDFYGTRLTSAGGTFTPASGLVEDTGGTFVSTIITCTQSATWTWTRTSGSFGSVDLGAASGGTASASSIQFSLSGPSFTTRFTRWSLSATSGSTSSTWTVELATEGEF
jgi:hypothetical protein